MADGRGGSAQGPARTRRTTWRWRSTSSSRCTATSILATTGRSLRASRRSTSTRCWSSANKRDAPSRNGRPATSAVRSPKATARRWPRCGWRPSTDCRSICFIDTPGAYPGIGAEERGQAQVIAQNMFEMSRLPTPVICVVIGEGGSGGALGIGVGDRVAMLEHAYYSVISPEGCAGILWKSRSFEEQAAQALEVHLQGSAAVRGHRRGDRRAARRRPSRPSSRWRRGSSSISSGSSANSLAQPLEQAARGALREVPPHGRLSGRVAGRARSERGTAPGRNSSHAARCRRADGAANSPRRRPRVSRRGGISRANLRGTTPRETGVPNVR